MAEPYELSLTEAVAEVAARRLSALELTESLLARIDAVEPRLLAWATLLPERALDAARAHDAGAASSGPLAGVPYGAKDIFDTAGVLTACGSKVWAERVPGEDAAAIVRAREAGAILLGKLHTTEFADGDPAPSFNPWNAEHTPGGSSAGSGVAVAARMVPWAFGSQTVGSVLRPACYNGVVGFKPTFGRISRAGVVPMATSFDHVGLLVRRVEDAALLLSALAGHDPADPFSSPAPAEDYAAAVVAGGAPPRLGLIRGWFFEEADAETRLTMEETAQKLARAGASVEEVDPRRRLRARLRRPPRDAGVRDGRLARAPLRGQRGAVRPEDQRVPPQRVRPHRPRLRGGVRLPARGAGARPQRAPQRRRPADADGVRPPLRATAPRRATPRFQSPWSYTGFPSISVPVGLSSDGLPLGAQLACAPLDDARLLRVAAWVEGTLGVELAPPV